MQEQAGSFGSTSPSPRHAAARAQQPLDLPGFLAHCFFCQGSHHPARCRIPLFSLTHPALGAFCNGGTKAKHLRAALPILQKPWEKSCAFPAGSSPLGRGWPGDFQPSSTNKIKSREQQGEGNHSFIFPGNKKGSRGDLPAFLTQALLFLHTKNKQSTEHGKQPAT